MIFVLSVAGILAHGNSAWTWPGGANTYDLQRQNSAGATVWDWAGAVSRNGFSFSPADGILSAQGDLFAHAVTTKAEPA